MALTTAERLTVDGVDLKTYAKNMGTLSTLAVPARRGENVVTAGRSGAVWTPGKPYEEGTIILSLWVRGTDDDGNIPSGSTPRREFFKRVDELTALFSKAHGLLELRHYLPDGSQRTIAVECIGAQNWTVQGANPLGRVDFELRAPTPFWASASAFSQVVLGDAVTSFGAGATAPLEDAVFTVTGPVTDGLIWDDVSKAYLRIGGTIAAGASIVIDAGAWTMTGASTDYGRLNFSGSYGKLLRWAPDPVTRGYRALLQGSSKTAATRVTITGRPKFLNG